MSRWLGDRCLESWLDDRCDSNLVVRCVARDKPETSKNVPSSSPKIFVVVT